MHVTYKYPYCARLPRLLAGISKRMEISKYFRTRCQLFFPSLFWGEEVARFPGHGDPNMQLAGKAGQIGRLYLTLRCPLTRQSFSTSPNVNINISLIAILQQHVVGATKVHCATTARPVCIQSAIAQSVQARQPRRARHPTRQRSMREKEAVATLPRHHRSMS